MYSNYLLICPLGNTDLPDCSPGAGAGRKMKTQQLYQMSKSKLQIVKPGVFLELHIGIGQIENVGTNSKHIQFKSIWFCTDQINLSKFPLTESMLRWHGRERELHVYSIAVKLKLVIQNQNRTQINLSPSLAQKRSRVLQDIVNISNNMRQDDAAVMHIAQKHMK